MTGLKTSCMGLHKGHSSPTRSHSRANTSKLGQGITLSGMARFVQIAVVPSPGPLAVRTHGGSGRLAIRALPEEKPRLPKKTGPELDSVRPLKSPVSPSAPTRNVAFGSALA